MQYVKQQIVDFLSTNLTQEYANWSPTTTYTLEVGTPTAASLALDGTYYYRSILTSNLNFRPTDYIDTKWVKWKVANTYAMIDLSSGSKSIKVGGNIQVVFSLAKDTDTIGIGYYEAETITVEVLSAADAVLWTYTTPSTINDNVIDWWTWTYSEYVYEADRATMIKIPPATGVKCRVTFNKHIDATQTACGFLIAGAAISMGDTLRGVRLSFNSFASKQYDDFGTLTIVKRSVQDLVDFETSIPANDITAMRRRIKEIYNDIILFILDESEDSNYENLLTLGVVETANEVLSNSKLSVISWSIFEAI